MSPTSYLDKGRRELWVFGTLAVLLVLARSAAFLIWEHIDFNADQAIVGLMAKHLSEFQRFPLFFYGQNYMLGVQSWIIAPFFWIARPSVAVMRMPLVILNAAAAVMLMRLMISQVGARPAVAFVAVLPFVVPTPVVAASFLETLGSSGIEPLVYILILWYLRGRPLAFGALLAFGFLHREFTIYALPALLAVHIADRAPWDAAAGRRALRALGGFALVWVALDYLRLHLEGASLFQQAQMLGRFACFRMAELVDRIGYVFAVVLPVMSGGTTIPLGQYAMRSSAVVGSALVGWAAGAALFLMLVRMGWLWTLKREKRPIGFAVYLALVGLCALAGYLLSCQFTFGRGPIVRYLNLALLLPIGCFAAFMAWEPSARLKSAVVAVFVLWGAANLVDNARVIRQAYVDPQPNPHRELTDFLIGRGIRYGRGFYWDAYVVDFLSNERVIMGSDGPVRIPDYERRVNENSETAIRIERTPCEGWMVVADWCIQLPARAAEAGPR